MSNIHSVHLLSLLYSLITEENDKLSVKKYFGIGEYQCIGNFFEKIYTAEEILKVDNLDILSNVSNTIKRTWPPQSSSDPNILLWIKNQIRFNYYLAAAGQVIFIFDEVLKKSNNKSGISYLPVEGNGWLAEIAKQCFNKDVYIYDVHKLIWYDYKYQEIISYNDMLEDIALNNYNQLAIYGSENFKLNKFNRNFICDFLYNISEEGLKKWIIQK